MGQGSLKVAHQRMYFPKYFGVNVLEDEFRTHLMEDKVSIVDQSLFEFLQLVISFRKSKCPQNVAGFGWLHADCFMPDATKGERDTFLLRSFPAILGLPALYRQHKSRQTICYGLG